jgi:uncharacterized membrane protein
MKLFSQENLHTFFKAGTFIKAVDSVVEITLGSLFYFLSTASVNKIIAAILGDELTEQPRDAIWNILLHGFNSVNASTQALWAFIFIGHGLVKIILVAGLLKKKIWIYPVTAGIFILFIIYQIYHLIYSPSVLLELITFYDIIFTFLIINEYRYHRLTT